jgi:DNA-binding sugar fermentation-stimulating protein
MKTAIFPCAFKGLPWPRLVPGTLIRRYKRFLADARVFKPADHIDADYGRELRRAVKKGLEIVAYDVLIDSDRIRIHRTIPFKL